MQKMLMVTLCLFFLMVNVAVAETIDDVISKHIEAIGGKKNLDGITTLQLEGKTLVMGQEIPFSLKIKKPNMIRMETQMQGKTVVQAFDGTNAWMKMGENTMPLPGEAAKHMADMADVGGPLVNYKEKGHSVELVGKEDLNGKPAYHVKLTTKEGEVNHFYIDAESFMIVKSTGTRKGPENKMIEAETVYSDYKDVQSVKFPHAIQSNAAGQSVEQKMEKITSNAELNNDIFKMPASASMPAMPKLPVPTEENKEKP